MQNGMNALPLTDASPNIRKCLFVVYPDSEETFRRYFPTVEERPSNRFLYVGEYTPGRLNVRTFIVTLPEHPDNFSPEELRQWMFRILLLARAHGITGVALAGILPSRFTGVTSIESPCVDGRLGTLYAVSATLHDALRIHNISMATAPIRIVGLGYIGWPYIHYLREIGCTNLMGIDPRFRGQYTRRGITFTNQLDVVQEGDVVIFLAGGGYQINVERLHQVIGINDMYPRFSNEQVRTMEANGNILYEVALKVTGVESSIKIEHFAADEIPGCLAQGLLQAAGVDTVGISQRDFDNIARVFEIHSPYHNS